MALLGGLWGALKVSTHIVFLNLDYILHPAALSFLLFYILKALVFDPSSLTVLPNLCFMFFVSLHRGDLDVLRALYTTLTPNPTPNPSLSPILRFVREFCFVILAILAPIQANQDYEPAAIIIACRNFAILATLGGIAGAVSTVLTICSLEKYDPKVEERRAGSGVMDKLIRWSIDLVGILTCVAAGTALVATFEGHWFPPVMWRWIAAGVSVGVLPLFFLCVMSTHAALFLSCRSHYKQFSCADTVTDFYVSVDEEPVEAFHC